jgi:hypothetical protein
MSYTFQNLLNDSSQLTLFLQDMAATQSGRVGDAAERSTAFSKAVYNRIEETHGLYRAYIKALDGLGYKGSPGIFIEPKQVDPSTAKSLSLSQNPTWTPKLKTGGTLTPQVMRCPSVCVDQLILFKEPNAKGQVLMALGTWCKEVYTHTDNPEKIEGLVLPAGGHWEHNGDRQAYFKRTGLMEKRDALKEPKGHATARQAADAELEEETRIARANVLYTHEIGAINRIADDSTAHVVSFLYVRVVEKAAQATDEIKNMFILPINDVHKVAKEGGTLQVGAKELTFIKGHEKLVQVMLAHPDVSAIVATILEESDRAKATAPPRHSRGYDDDIGI